METVPFKSDLSICKALKAEFPGYRKRDLWISITESVKPFGYWWDGGSRTEYWTLTDGHLARLSVPNGPPQFTKGVMAESVALRPGLQVVTTGVFCGKTATMRVYIHPDDVLAPAGKVVA